MKNFRKVIEEVKSKEYKMGSKGNAIVQSERTELKVLLTQAIADDMKEIEEIDVLEVPKGFVILIQNDVEGAIPVEVQIITKPLDYDYDLLHEDFLDKQTKE